MLTSSLINVAILMYCLAPSGLLNQLGVHSVRKDLDVQALPSPWYMNDDVQYFPPAGQELPREDRTLAEKVVIREGTLSEKCGLGLEAIKRPDQEIAALKSSASGIKSALSLGEQIKKQSPEKLPYATGWNGKFSLTWDDEGGYCFAGTQYRITEPEIRYGIDSSGW